jgi:hypothetical protein
VAKVIEFYIPNNFRKQIEELLRVISDRPSRDLPTPARLFGNGSYSHFTISGYASAARKRIGPRWD